LDRFRVNPAIMIKFSNRMGSIFLSYRREDAEGQAGRLYDDLVAVFGSNSVFMDVSAIQPGRDFRKAIDQSLNACGVFLSLIGKSWLTAKDPSNQPRLEDRADFVRIETATALRRDIPVIPVLVQGASMPKSDQLPDDLKDFAYRNAVELTHSRWDSDVQILISSLRPYVSGPSRQPESEVIRLGKKANGAKFLALAAVVLLVVAGMAFYLRSVQKVVVPPASKSAETMAPPAAVHSPAPEPAKRRPEKAVSRQATVNPEFTKLKDFSLAATQEALADNPKRYTYTLSLKAPSGIIDDISRVHYELVYDPNPLSLDGGSAPAFSAVYEGWGCYETVVMTVHFKSPGSQPLKKTLNMCQALNK
jgi:hypothetical protein